MTTSTLWTFSSSNMRVRTSRLVELSSATNTFNPAFPLAVVEGFGVAGFAGLTFPVWAAGLNGLGVLGRSRERPDLPSSTAKAAPAPPSGLSRRSDSRLALRETSLEGGASDILDTVISSLSQFIVTHTQENSP